MANIRYVPFLLSLKDSEDWLLFDHFLSKDGLQDDDAKDFAGKEFMGVTRLDIKEEFMVAYHQVPITA